MAILVRNIYSKLVNKTVVVIIANLSSLTFLQSERSNPAGNSDNNTTHSLYFDGI